MAVIRPNAEPAVTTVAAGDIFLIDGATGVRALAASSVPVLDANGNAAFNNLITGFASVPTAAATTVLTAASAPTQYFTGTTTQTVQLPVVSTLALNHPFTIENASTGLVTINSSGGNLVTAVGPGATVTVKCVAVTGTSSSSWSTKFDTVLAASGKVLTLSNSLTLAGTDGTVMTFPSTSATIARTDVGQTFTGTNVFGVLTATTINAFTLGGAITAAGNNITGAGVVTMATLTATTINAFTLGGAITALGNNVSGVGLLTSGAHVVTSNSAIAFAAGANGSSNPVLAVDASTASVATGIKIKGAAAAAGASISVTSSGAAEALLIDALGTGGISFGFTSTGANTFYRASTFLNAITYGGVTLTNAVSGTGNMVLTASPTFTGTPAAPTATVGTNTTQLATTAFVLANGGSTLRPPQGRLTLVSGLPVMGTSNAAATSVIWTPTGGGMVPIYNGTSFVMTPVAEISQATTDTTKSPAAVGASQVFDLFVWNDAGTIRCTRGPAWTNSTTRGYTFTSVNGIPLNTSAITNGPGASLGTWVGTIASNAGSTIDFIYGAAGAGGVAGVFNVWNAYNQAEIDCKVINTSATYTYTTATVRQADASAGMQVSLVNGSATSVIDVSYKDFFQPAATGAAAIIGVSLDATNAFNTAAEAYFQSQGGSSFSFMETRDQIKPGIGSHFFAAVEKGDGTNANNFNTSGAANIFGLNFKAWM
jgi:hypothetical protein